jgi:hypothetical protein
MRKDPDTPIYSPNAVEIRDGAVHYHFADKDLQSYMETNYGFVWDPDHDCGPNLYTGVHHYGAYVAKASWMPDGSLHIGINQGIRAWHNTQPELVRQDELAKEKATNAKVLGIGIWQTIGFIAFLIAMGTSSHADTNFAPIFIIGWIIWIFLGFLPVIINYEPKSELGKFIHEISPYIGAAIVAKHVYDRHEKRQAEQIADAVRRGLL